ncbi:MULTISPECIES: iron-containing redox enzyme family protein [Streptomyces]|uniref:iron-containing redox enzyme family protein n=1 Tax=Streptomyces TaxID=1883 RepID=UPI0002D337C4|nr:MULTISPECIES: iron-containing redox enzyme family protein [Streptomyces]
MSTEAHLLDQKSGVDAYPVVEEVSSLLKRPAEDLDASVTIAERAVLRAAVSDLNARSAAGDPAAFYGQQLLLSRIYALSTQLPEGPTAEGSTFVHEVLRLLEQATAAAEDAALEPGALDAAPTEPSAYLSWLKKSAREHRVYKHPYYREFIRDHATADDLRNYVIQESVVDGRFDDLLATMQVGTSGDAKMEIAENFWDEMGNGDPSQVHTHLFNQIFRVFDIPAQELERSLTANALLSGNLAVLLCRYRHLYPEAVGFLGMTEWLAPERFVHVVHAWERLGLPDVGIVYHKLHITVDSRHAAGWFHNVVVPAATSERMRRAIARGTLWRLNSSARYLDERMPDLATHRPV